MEPRNFTLSLQKTSIVFWAEWNDLKQGLLHILVRHYLQLQQVVPGLRSMMARLPCDLLRDIANIAKSQGVQPGMEVIFDDAFRHKTTAKNLMDAQGLIADYMEGVLKASLWKGKYANTGGKPQHRFSVSDRGSPMYLVVATAQEGSWQRIITAFLKPQKVVKRAKPKKPPRNLFQISAGGSIWTSRGR